MNPIRVAISGLPKLLSEVLATYLARHRDIEVVSTDGVADPAELVRSCGADVVVLGGGPDLPDSAFALFRAIPRVAVLAISPCGREASRFRLVGERTRLDEASPQEIVSTIRETIHRDLFEEAGVDG